MCSNAPSYGGSYGSSYGGYQSMRPSNISIAPGQPGGYPWPSMNQPMRYAPPGMQAPQMPPGVSGRTMFSQLPPGVGAPVGTGGYDQGPQQPQPEPMQQYAPNVFASQQAGQPIYFPGGGIGFNFGQ